MVIGIVAALREEINPLLRLLGHDISSGHPDKWPVVLDFYKHQLVLSVCGFGKVNAAVAAQELIISHGVECLMNIGTATAVNKKLDIGDIVVSKKFIQHDFDAMPITSRFGEIPMDVIFEKTDTPKLIATRDFKADPTKINDVITSSEHCRFVDIEARYPRVVSGKFVSGDQIVKSNEKMEWLRVEFEADCVDMESASMAQVCAKYALSFLGIRVISDKGHERFSSGLMPYFDQACENLARLMICYITHNEEITDEQLFSWRF